MLYLCSMINYNEHSYWSVFRKHKVITSWRDLSVDDAIRFGDEVKHMGEVVGYYIKEGYNVVELNYKTSKSGVLPEKLKYRVVYTLLYLNPELSFEALVECAQAYLGHLMDSDKIELKKEWVKSLVDYCSDNLQEESLYKRKRFFWNERGRLLPSPVKQSISGVQRSMQKKKDTLDLIGREVFSIIEESDEFLTLKLLTAKLDKFHYNTMRAYIPIFKEDLDKHNLNTFGTNDYNEYRRLKNEAIVKQAARELRVGGQKDSVTNIAKETGLHYNTVYGIIKSLKQTQ